MSGPSIGVYGKVRSQGDFLRGAAGGLSRVGFDRWLEEAVGQLSVERTTLPEEPAGFVYSPGEAESGFVGALAASEDSVGRRFPLLVFLELPADAVKGAWPILPALYAPFTRAAGELILAGRDLPGADFVARAQELGSAAPGAPAGTEVATLSNESSFALATALGRSAPGLAYALRTFSLACDQAPRPGATAASITVDAPAPSPAAREMWLDLALRRARRRGAPPPPLAFWTEGATGRLLLAMGPPAPAMLAFLANPRHRSQRFWPLRTEVPAATEQALAALAPGQRRCVEDPRSSLAQLVAEFSQ
jgi:type VI secretion system protein ImpM